LTLHPSVEGNSAAHRLPPTIAVHQMPIFDGRSYTLAIFRPVAIGPRRTTDPRERTVKKASGLRLQRSEPDPAAPVPPEDPRKCNVAEVGHAVNESAAVKYAPCSDDGSRGL